MHIYKKKILSCYQGFFRMQFFFSWVGGGTLITSNHQHLTYSLQSLGLKTKPLASNQPSCGEHERIAAFLSLSCLCFLRCSAPETHFHFHLTTPESRAQNQTNIAAANVPRLMEQGLICICVRRVGATSEPCARLISSSLHRTLSDSGFLLLLADRPVGALRRL